MHRYATRGETEDGHIVRIASECFNVLLNPFQGSNLIHESITSLGLVWMLFTQRRKCKMPQASETIVDRDKNDVLLRKLMPEILRTRAGPSGEAATMYPNHDRQRCPGFGPGRFPDIQVQAIFR